MKAAPTPNDEQTRIATLKALNLLDSKPSEKFDQITRLIKPLFDVPIALVSLVDTHRQWFLSNVGLDASETPRDVSFCGHAIMTNDTFVIEDTHLDPDFADNPLVLGDPNVRFYAGVPLLTANNSKIGTLCIIDTKPRKFTAADDTVLRTLASLVEREIREINFNTTDELTGIPNLRGFVSLAAPMLSHGDNASETSVLVALTLCGLDKINNEEGRLVGDKLLSSFGTILSTTQNFADICCRVKNNDFALLFIDAELSDAHQKLSQFSSELVSLLSKACDMEFGGVSVKYGATVINHGEIVDFKMAYNTALSEIEMD